MKIISRLNNNENNNTLNVELSGTIENIFKEPIVLRFFANGVDIDKDIEEINGMDCSVIPSVRGIHVNFDDEIVVNAYGEFRPEEAEPVEGHVTVTTSGGLASKTVLITNGVTTVKQVLNDRVAAALGTTADALKNMNINVNDELTTLSAVLNDGDELILEPRKAGKNGSGHVQVVFHDSEGFTASIDMNAEDSVADACEKLFGLTDSKYVTDGDVVRIEDNELGTLYDILMSAPLEKFGKAVINVLIDNVITDTTNELTADADEEATEDLRADGMSDEEVVDRGFGSVRLSLSGGVSQMTFAIIPGQTKVREVVFSNKAMNVLAMSREQLEGMNVYVNDVPACLDAVLCNNDELILEPRKAGKNGTK